MMRSDWRVRTLCAWLVGSAALWGAGCKKEQPQAGALPDAGGLETKPVAKVAKPLRFSGVTLKRDPSFVNVTYTLTNPGTAQARGEACLALLDEMGFVTHERNLGSITVKGGTDDVFEDRVYLPEEHWDSVLTVLLFTVNGMRCEGADFQAASEPLRLRASGEPAAADAPAPKRPGKLEPGEIELSGVSLRQGAEADEYVLEYTLKNVSRRRINAQACIQGYGADEDVSEDRASVLADDLSMRSLAAGATKTFTDRIELVDSLRWDEVVALDLFLDARGCESKPETAPVRLRFEKAAGLDASDEEESQPDEFDVSDPDAETTEEDETGMDSSDAYDPGEEFPPEPAPSDEETAD
ncbi:MULTISPECIES: hypothetical protein [unclassified Corallococcus]|uniref:hypothetical protein n=1 Tax=unclassified Corallococcus TaxID=2685029 RepID=UPI001A8E91E2|nr:MULTISPECIES: hypothetical protein [unclassified Corallococcus]MBN9686556.1 hypothetical protein [Corallococcus sp. NCSPR001]WAS82019.1 hypothetical protein O0N60_22125 [Corallococcus sp. NCRR]